MPGIEEYFTMAYGIIDLRSGVLKMVQAGHPHPLLLRKDGSAEFIGDGGVPIGLLPGISYTQFEAHLNVGDRLLLYSDGFSECRLESGEMLEPEGLLDIVRECDPAQGGQEFLDDLFWRLTQVMSSEHGLEDDVSATFLEYNGP